VGFAAQGRGFCKGGEKRFPREEPKAFPIRLKKNGTRERKGGLEPTTQTRKTESHSPEKPWKKKKGRTKHGKLRYCTAELWPGENPKIQKNFDTQTGYSKKKTTTKTEERKTRRSVAGSLMGPVKTKNQWVPVIAKTHKA